LLQRAIDLALESYLFDIVVVSSEHIQTLEIAQRGGATPLHRPPKLASDIAETEEVMNHAINMYPQYKTLCTIYCQAGAFITPATLQDSHARFDFRNPLVSWITELDKDAGQFYWVNTLRFQKAWERGEQLLSQNIDKWPLAAHDVHDINTESDWRIAEMKYRRLGE
jgi:N-acylneuraminate cytidylyltransferase